MNTKTQNKHSDVVDVLDLVEAVTRVCICNKQHKLKLTKPQNE